MVQHADEIAVRFELALHVGADAESDEEMFGRKRVSPGATGRLSSMRSSCGEVRREFSMASSVVPAESTS